MAASFSDIRYWRRVRSAGRKAGRRFGSETLMLGTEFKWKLSPERAPARPEKPEGRLRKGAELLEFTFAFLPLTACSSC